MRRKTSPEEEIQYLIEDTIRGYRRAAKYRAALLDEVELTPTSAEKSQTMVEMATALARICDMMSRELNALYELKGRIAQEANQKLHIVIEQVDSPWNKEDNKKED
jgi:Na+/phosphate symporter